jgi:predicted nucleotidyltransferase
MKPGPQSFFRYPLSTLLGTESSVRVLRELALHGEELTTTVLAARTGLTDQSVRNAMRTLASSDLLRVYGQGRAGSYKLDVSHPVARMVADLFRAEDDRAKAVQERIGRMAGKLDPAPMAVWMFGSVARAEDGPDSDLDLVLVIEDDGATERVADDFREMLRDVEKALAVSISVVPLSTADVLRLSNGSDPFWSEVLSDGAALYGDGPEILLARLKRAARGGMPRGGSRG